MSANQARIQPLPIQLHLRPRQQRSETERISGTVEQPRERLQKFLESLWHKAAVARRRPYIPVADFSYGQQCKDQSLPNGLQFR